MFSLRRTALRRTALRRTARPALIAALLLALTTGFSTEARAANGFLTYRMRDGSDGSVVNPVNGNCYVFDDAATSVTNQTDTTAHVYSGFFCTDFLADVRPTESVVFGGTLGHSVIFG